MPNLHTPVFLQIDTVEQLNAVKNMLSMIMDMKSDMFTDEAYLQANNIRELASKSDKEIREAMSLRDKIIFSNLDEMLALNDIFHKLNTAIRKAQADER